MLELLRRNIWAIIVTVLSGAASFGAYKQALATVEQNVSTHTQQIQELQVGQASDHQLLLDIKDQVSEMHDDVKYILKSQQKK